MEENAAVLEQIEHFLDQVETGDIPSSREAMNLLILKLGGSRYLLPTDLREESQHYIMMLFMSYVLKQFKD